MCPSTLGMIITSLKNISFLHVCQDVRCDVNFKIDRPSPKSFLEKNLFLNNMLSKDQVNRRNTFTGKTCTIS